MTLIDSFQPLLFFSALLHDVYLSRTVRVGQIACGFLTVYNFDSISSFFYPEIEILPQDINWHEKYRTKKDLTKERNKSTAKWQTDSSSWSHLSWWWRRRWWRFASVSFPSGRQTTHRARWLRLFAAHKDYGSAVWRCHRDTGNVTSMISSFWVYQRHCNVHALVSAWLLHYR